MSQKSEILGLRRSSQRIGKLYPILLDAYGNIIDGQHRIEADEKWPRIQLRHIETDKDRLLVRLMSNVCRRNVSAKEKREILGRLGEIYLTEGIARGKIAQRIVEETGMSYRWAMTYLPDDLKERPGLGGPAKAVEFDKSKEKDKSKVELFAGEGSILFSETQKKVLTVRNYVNTRFVNVLLDRDFFVRFEKIASKWKTTPDVIISNALVSVLKQLEDMEIDG